MLPKGTYIHLSCDESEKPRVTSCSHCGREKLRWVHSILHRETGDTFSVGSECARVLTQDLYSIETKEKHERKRARRAHKNSIQYSHLDIACLAFGIID